MYIVYFYIVYLSFLFYFSFFIFLAIAELWSLDNFASLLVHRPGLIPIAFTIRIIYGRVQEVGELFATMKTVGILCNVRIFFENECMALELNDNLQLLYRWDIDAANLLLSPLLLTIRPLSAEHKRSFLSSFYLSEAEQLKSHLTSIPCKFLLFFCEQKY